MISERGIKLIREFEGLSLEAYPDPATGGEPYTIGVGHTGDVKSGDTCAETEALEWLAEDCREAEACIEAFVEPELTQGQRDALIAFIFNIGCGNFKSSTMLQLINSGNLDAAAKQFNRWVNVAGKPMPGLARRRAAEIAMFLGVGDTGYA